MKFRYLALSALLLAGCASEPSKQVVKQRNTPLTQAPPSNINATWAMFTEDAASHYGVDEKLLSDYDNGFDFASVWQYLRDVTGLPVISDLAFGHDADTVTLPLGARARLRVANHQAELQASGHPVLPEH